MQIAELTPVRRCFRHSNGQIVDPSEIELVSSLGKEVSQGTVHEWPQITPAEESRAATSLFGCVAGETFEASPLLNRMHRMDMNWELLRFTWDFIRRRCLEDGRVICVERRT